MIATTNNKNKTSNTIAKKNRNEIQDFVNSCSHGPIIILSSDIDFSIFENSNRHIISINYESNLMQITKTLFNRIGGKTLISSIDSNNFNPSKYISGAAGAILDIGNIDNNIPAIFYFQEIQKMLKIEGCLRIRNRNIESEVNLILNQTPITTLSSMNSEYFYKLVLNKLGIEVINSSYKQKNKVLNLILNAKKVDKLEMDSISQFYNDLTPIYDSLISDSKHIIPAWTKRIAKMFQGQKIRLLDLACKTGVTASVLRSNNVKGDFFGIDYSDEMIKWCNDKGHYNATARYDFSMHLPIIEKKYFDLITMFGATEFIFNISNILIEIKSSLKEHGLLGVTFEEKSNHQENMYFDKKLKVNKYSYSKEDLYNIFNKAGLKIVELRKSCIKRNLDSSCSKKLIYILAEKPIVNSIQ